MEEANFLKMILANPQDDSTRLVYADWLEETGSDEAIKKAEFLRLTVRLAPRSKSKVSRDHLRKRLQELAADLDTDWLAIVSHLNVENCYEIPQRGGHLQTISIKFDLQCDRKWEELEPTDDVSQRYCDSCDKTVHYCGTILEAREHAKARNCIAVDSGIVRREDDLGMLQYVMLGMPSPESIRERRELEKPDAVSAKREELKKQKSAKKHLTDKTD